MHPAIHKILFLQNRFFKNFFFQKFVLFFIYIKKICIFVLLKIVNKNKEYGKRD